MSKLRKILAATGAVAALSIAATGAWAQDCPRGDLDARYCDRDGDLVADTPEDESQLIDPNPLIFAYTPVEDPAVYKTAWADFLDYLKEKTAKTSSFSLSSQTQPKLKLCALAVCILPASTQVQIRWR